MKHEVGAVLRPVNVVRLVEIGPELRPEICAYESDVAKVTRQGPVDVDTTKTVRDEIATYGKLQSHHRLGGINFHLLHTWQGPNRYPGKEHVYLLKSLGFFGGLKHLWDPYTLDDDQLRALTESLVLWTCGHRQPSRLYVCVRVIECNWPNLFEDVAQVLHAMNHNAGMSTS